MFSGVLQNTNMLPCLEDKGTNLTEMGYWWHSLKMNQQGSMVQVAENLQMVTGLLGLEVEHLYEAGSMMELLVSLGKKGFRFSRVEARE